MSTHHDLTRRQFIKNLGVAGAGFTVGVALSGVLNGSVGSTIASEAQYRVYLYG